MKAQILSTVLVISGSMLGLAYDHDTVIRGVDIHKDWKTPLAGQTRSPCPMLNALSNHGFINRDGKDLTADEVQPVLMDLLGFNKVMAQRLFQAGLSTTKRGSNSTSFSYSDLNVHGALEHDGSISRGDHFYGNAVSFDARTFAIAKAYWSTPNITMQQAADARLGTVYLKNATNPQFNLTAKVHLQLSWGEQLLWMTVFGDLKDGDFAAMEARRDWVVYLFEQERLPYALGWKGKPAGTITEKLFSPGMQKLIDMTGGSFPLPVGFDGTARNETADPLGPPASNIVSKRGQ